MDRTHLVTLRSFSKEMDADIAKQHLESASIGAFMRKDDYGGMQPCLQAAQDVFLEVNEENCRKAEQVLKSRDI
jgi:hypothetical protein